MAFGRPSSKHKRGKMKRTLIIVLTAIITNVVIGGYQIKLLDSGRTKLIVYGNTYTNFALIMTILYPGLFIPIIME